MRQYCLREVVNRSGDPEGMMKVLTSFGGPLPLFSLLSENERDDVLDGRCVYRQHDYQVILDYTQMWGPPDATLDMGREITPNQATS